MSEATRVLRALAARQRRMLAIGCALLLAILVMGTLVPLPYSPVSPDVTIQLQPPSTDHWFGTDPSGFDVLSRTMASAGRDVPLALGGALLSLALGVPLGLLVSTKSPWSERAMRGLDALQAFPLVILAIAIVTIMGDSLINVVVAIAAINVPRFMRLVRSEVLSLRELRFIEAARAMGAGRARIMFRHLLPNIVNVALAQFSLAAAHALVVIAALSFLGVGVSPPEPSWGLMIQEGARLMTSGQWWTVVFPGLGVFISVTAFNLISDGVVAARES